MAKAKSKTTIAPSTAWDILWRNYIKALKSPQTPANLDKVERIKKQIDSFDERWLGHPAPAALQKTAERIVRQAKSRSHAEVRKLATFGWPHDKPLENDSVDLRNAIQDEAKRVEASL